MGEYAAMIVGSGLTVTLFLGGWSLPFGLDSLLPAQTWWVGIFHTLVFFGKVILFLLFFIWVRWSLPRFRYDQLMKLGWVYLFEIALANILLTAILIMVL
jgi:NADH-quinone oxidoreductase subunit H